jgi:hypothetical protein
MVLFINISALSFNMALLSKSFNFVFRAKSFLLPLLLLFGFCFIGNKEIDMIYFSTRQQARNFAKGRKTVVDLMGKGAKLTDVFKVSASMSKRWAVKVL